MLSSEVIVLLDEACSRLRKFTESEGEKYELANRTFEDFRRKIEAWNDEESLDFVREYALGHGAEAIASSGAGSWVTPDFNIFMDLRETKDVVRRTLNLRKQRRLTPQLWIEIKKKENSLDKRVRSYAPVTGRPLMLVRRLIDMTFLEISTTIADIDRVRDTFTVLTEGKESPEQPFEALQMKIRSIVDDYIKLRGLQGEGEIFKAMIARFVLEGEE